MFGVGTVSATCETLPKKFAEWVERHMQEATGQPTRLDYFTAISIVVGIIGILVSMWYNRSSNFVAVWTALVDKMQEEKVRLGRAFLRSLQARSEGEAIARSQWLAFVPSWWPARIL